MNSGKIDARDIDYPYKELPVMDLAPIMNGDREAIKELAGKWREAAETLGFMCLVNHGIPQEKIEKMEEQIIKFHDKDVDFKMDIKARGTSRILWMHKDEQEQQQQLKQFSDPFKFDSLQI